jgi:hypothetical protein
MKTLKQQNNFLLTIVTVLSVVLASFIIIGGIFLISKKIQWMEHDTDGKVCLKQSEYKRMVGKESCKESAQNAMPVRNDDRDRKVLNDPLYPALNRSEFDVHNNTVSAIARKELYNTTQEFTDRYRLVGYVTNTNENKDVGGNSWKLMARQKNKNQADFFMVPTNNNYDMKIMLNNDIVIGEKLRDVYTIPKQLVFKTPLLNDSPYEVTELPMNDFTSNYN